MATLFEAYVTNAGKYSEGQLVGENTENFPHNRPREGGRALF